ncbi:MAG: type II secretion system protein [Prochloraceae cyanobacterium]
MELPTKSNSQTLPKLLFKAESLENNSHNSSQCGFTLLELMITVFMISVLAIFALPNFLGTQGKSLSIQSTLNISAINILNKN